MLNESQNIEYKESWHDEYLKWICGFANAQGSRIYIGVNDDTAVVGLPVSIIIKQPSITAKQMVVMTDIPQRTIERELSVLTFVELKVHALWYVERELSVLQKSEVLYRIGAPRTGKWVIAEQMIKE